MHNKNLLWAIILMVVSMVCTVQGSNYKSQNASYRSQDASYRSQDASYRSQDASYRLQVASDRSQDSLVVRATPMNENECFVEWDLIPENYWEIIYDDGEAEELVVWATAGSENAVKFQPSGYPSVVYGGSLYVGDGSFPNGNWLNTDFQIIVYDDDGPAYLPGTPLDSTTVTVTNFGWVEFWGLNVMISEGEFYISMKQLTSAPDAAPLGVDYTTPTFQRSYSKLAGNIWQFSVYQDFMIRAYVAGDPGIMYYPVAMVEEMQSCDPNSGTLTVIGSSTGNEYTDVIYDQTNGYIRYAIKIIYQGSGETGWFYSNLVGNNTTASVTFNLEMINGDPVPDAQIDMVALDCMNNTYTLLTGPDGTATHDSVFQGHYNIYAHKPGYDSIISLNTYILNDTVINWVMDELYLGPVSVSVDTQSSIMSWEHPFPMDAGREFQSYSIFLDDSLIESGGMTSVQLPYMEYGTEHIASIFAAYTTGNSDTTNVEFTSGYLAKPENLDGEPMDNAAHLWWDAPRIPDTTAENRDMWDIVFHYQAAMASVEYGIETDGEYLYTTQSTGDLINKYDDDGTPLYSFSIPGVSGLKDLAYDPDEEWMYGGDGGNTCYVMDFNSETLVRTFTAPVNIRAIAYDDEQDGFWAYNWDSDDIVLFDKQGNTLQIFQTGNFENYSGFAYDNWTTGSPTLWGITGNGTEVFLVQIDLLTGNEIFNIEVYDLLNYGSNPPGGLFTHWMFQDIYTLGGVLQDESLFGFELMTWPYYPGSGGIVPSNLIGYNVYRDSVLHDFVAHVPGDTTAEYYDMGLTPGTYIYDVSALYDMEPYGMPGDTGESILEGPLYINNNSCHVMPFTEEWLTGTFEVNNWYHDTNWMVNGATGNPEPSAEFAGDPSLSYYTSNLTSWYINCYGLNGPFIDGEIWFEFDIKLNNLNPTGQEKLTVMAWCGDKWDTINAFDNTAGSFDWQHHKLNITECAWGVELFQIRFSCSGLSSSDIESWLVDNIQVYRFCPAPFNLEYEEVSWHQYLLTWHAPDYTPVRDLTGYNVYIDNDFLENPTDTFYYWFPQNGGEFEVNVTAAYEDCESLYSDTATISVPVGIEEVTDEVILIYPNPVRDLLEIQAVYEIRKVELFGPHGTRLISTHNAGRKIRINTFSLAKGIYLLKAEHENGVILRKVLVQ